MISKVYDYIKLRRKFVFNFLLYNSFKEANTKLLKKVFFNQKTLITGKGTVRFGENIVLGFKLGGFHSGGSIELQARTKDSKIIIEDNVSTNNNVFICSSNYIKIGANTLIGQNVIITDFEAHGIDPTKRRRVGEVGSVVLGNNVWVGNNVTILKNCEVGDNTIIATGAVVTKSFPSNVIVGGVPAKIIKKFDQIV